MCPLWGLGFKNAQNQNTVRRGRTRRTLRGLPPVGWSTIEGSEPGELLSRRVLAPLGPGTERQVRHWSIHLRSPRLRGGVEACRDPPSPFGSGGISFTLMVYRFCHSRPEAVVIHAVRRWCACGCAHGCAVCAQGSTRAGAWPQPGRWRGMRARGAARVREGG